MFRLEKLRKEAGLSQNELAKNINLTQQRISAYETGKREPDLETLKLLAKYFNVSIDYLLGNSYSILNTEGLEDEDLKELQKQIDYIKKIKNKK